MIELRGISKTFSLGDVSQVQALEPLSLRIADGEFVILMGGNGSGKTTLLEIISGAIRPSTGQVLINGSDVTGLPEYRRSRWIGRVFQNPLAGTAPELSILDNFRLAALRTRPKKLVIGITERFRGEVRERIAGLGLGLEDKLEQPMGTLSGGQRQALTLLMSVMDHTDILLLDEPTAALDPQSARIVLSAAEGLVSELGLTAILITHNPGDALRLGGRLLQLDKGRVIRDLSGPAKVQLQLADMHAFFGGV